MRGHTREVASKARKLAYKKSLETAEWKVKRAQVLERDGHRCRHCESLEELQVHHLFYSESREEESIDQLITLCRSCHLRLHNNQAKKRTTRLTVQEKKARRTALYGKLQHEKIRELAGVDHDAWLKKMEREIARDEALAAAGVQPRPKDSKPRHSSKRKSKRKPERITPIRFNVGAVAEILA